MRHDHFYIHAGFNDDIMNLELDLELESDFDIDREWEAFVADQERAQNDCASSHTSPVPTNSTSAMNSKLFDDIECPF